MYGAEIWGWRGYKELKSRMEEERKKFFEKSGYCNSGITLIMCTDDFLWP